MAWIDEQGRLTLEIRYYMFLDGFNVPISCHKVEYWIEIITNGIDRNQYNFLWHWLNRDSVNQDGNNRDCKSKHSNLDTFKSKNLFKCNLLKLISAHARQWSNPASELCAWVLLFYHRKWNLMQQSIKLFNAKEFLM